MARLGADHHVEQAYTVGDREELLRRLGPDDGLLAAWTGNYRTDVFWVDDVEAARGAQLTIELIRPVAPQSALSRRMSSRSRGRPAARFMAMRCSRLQTRSGIPSSEPSIALAASAP